MAHEEIQKGRSLSEAPRTFSGKREPFGGWIVGGPSVFKLLLSLGDDLFEGGRSILIHMIVTTKEPYFLFIDSLTKVKLIDERWNEESWDFSSVQRITPEDDHDGNHWYFEGWIKHADKNSDQQLRLVKGMYSVKRREGFLIP